MELKIQNQGCPAHWDKPKSICYYCIVELEKIEEETLTTLREVFDIVYAVGELRSPLRTIEDILSAGAQEHFPASTMPTASGISNVGGQYGNTNGDLGTEMATGMPYQSTTLEGFPAATVPSTVNAAGMLYVEEHVAAGAEARQPMESYQQATNEYIGPDDTDTSYLSAFIQNMIWDISQPAYMANTFGDAHLSPGWLEEPFSPSEVYADGDLPPAQPATGPGNQNIVMQLPGEKGVHTALVFDPNRMLDAD